jgi:hypothetical protein
MEEVEIVYDHLVYLRTFDIIYGHLGYFLFIWYISSVLVRITEKIWPENLASQAQRAMKVFL